MTPGFGYFDSQWQMPYGTGMDWNSWNSWNTTPYYGGYDYNYSTNPNSVVTGDSTDEPTGDFLEKQKAKEEEIAKARILGYAQKSMLEKGLSKYTTTITTPEGTQRVVYADENGQPIKYKKDENGQVVFDEKGMPVKDPNAPEGTGYVDVVDKKSIEKEKQKVEAGKKADGTSVESMSAEEYEKKVPWWKRACRAVGNMAQGVWNMGKSLVGFGPDGKWDPLKALKNAAIIAAGVALTVVCPAAGPVLLYAGLAMGAAQVGKGVYKACTAKTVEEIDAAWQDTGVGVASVIASRAGLKSMGSAAKVSAFTPKGAATIIRGQASKSAITFKGGFKWNQAQFKANVNEMNPFTKAERNFKATEKQTAEFTQGRIQEIDRTLASTTDPAERALLTAERNALESSRNLVSTAKTKVDFSDVSSNTTTHLSKIKDARLALRKGETVEINGVTINPTEANLVQVETALQRAEALSNQYNQLVAAKNTMMNSVMYRNANKLSCNIGGKQYRICTKRMVARAPQRAAYMEGTPKSGLLKTAWSNKGKAFNYGMKLTMWQYETYKAMPTAGQFYANADRMFTKQHYEYGSMYDIAGGFVDGIFGTNSGAAYAPKTIAAADVKANIESYDKAIANIQTQMNEIDNQLRELSRA